MAAFRFRQRRVRRWWYAGATLVAAALFFVFYVAGAIADNASGCDFSPANNGVQGCLGALSGSTFAGGDGNLSTNPTTFGTTDWQNVAALNAGFDLASGSGDNSLGQGTKEDNPNVSVVSGSIPPNKSDITRFYESSETSNVNSHIFLYLGWERTNVLGSANFDFEINQAKNQPVMTTPGAKTLVRTAGDLLVTYDFSNGGGRPTIGLLRWVTSATVPVVTGFATNACFSANSFPCWGDQLTLDGTDSVAAVNNLDPVTDPLFPGQPNYINPLPALQFGETAIDLTKSGVFTPGVCQAFGSAFVRSRSSTSFTAEIKDFIAPIPINVSNCGEIKIIKQSDPRGQNQVFSFTSASAKLPTNASAGGVTCPGNSGGGIQSDGSFCLNDTGNTGKTLGSTDPAQNSTGNTVDATNVQQGTYTVSEGAEPGGFTFESLTCTADSGSGSTVTTSSGTATIGLKPNGVVTCVYANKLNTATLTTQASNTGTVLPGTSVTDTAKVAGSTSTFPTGTVKFSLCGPLQSASGCSTNDGSAGNGSLGNSSPAGTSTATSSAVNAGTPLAEGIWCFEASWPGDTNYPAALDATSATNECFTVKKDNTSTVTHPSDSSGTSKSTILLGQSIYDTAVVTGTAAGGTPTGNVTFHECGPLTSGNCSTGGNPVGSPVALGAPTTATTATAISAAFTPASTGTYCFRADYGGNTVYNGSSDPSDTTSQTECFTVTQIATTTTTTPSSTGNLSPGLTAPVYFGDASMYDHAVVQAATPGGGVPTGFVDFWICNPTQVATNGGTCSSGGTPVGGDVSLGTALGDSPPDAAADSPAFTNGGSGVNQTGTWCWRAVYTPSGTNGSHYTGSSDTRSSECFTVTDTTTSSSQQIWYPNDSASVSADHNGSTIYGTLTLQLYTGANCVAGHQVPGLGPYTTTVTQANATHTISVNSGTQTSFGINTDQATTSVSWKAVFTSGDPNVSGSFRCENSSVSISN